MSNDAITFQYEYKVEGRDYAGTKFSREGRARPTVQLSDFERDFQDDALFAKAAEGAIQHAYTFDVEKGGLNGISELSLTIKNVAVQSYDGQWVMNGKEIDSPQW